MDIQSAQLNENISAARAGEAKAAAKGSFMGSKVTQELDPVSLLADAAEELTFSLSESEETRLDERQEKAKDKGAFNPYVEAAGKLARESEKFGHPLNRLEKLLKARDRANLAELLDALDQTLPKGEGDPADSFILLAGLKDRLGASHPLAGSLDAALEKLAEKHTFPIASGLAADLTAPAFPGLEEGEARGAYRSILTEAASPRETLAALRDRFGDDRLEQGLDFLMTALGNEISATGLALDKAQLKSLTDDLAATRVLSLIRARGAAALERLDKAHGLKSRLGPDRMLDALLAARDNQYVGGQDFQRLAQLAGPMDTEREVLFLQDLLHGLRDLPDQAYESHEDRQRLQGALQNAVDDAVRREEEELGYGL